MRKVSFADMHCSVARTLEIVGEWWTLLILRDCFLGIRRFDDFVERLGISRNVLTTRLDTLVDAGVLERRPYDEGRGRYDYVLTEKGLALWPVITAIRQWGDEYVLGQDHAPVLLEHRGRGHLTHVLPTCDVCGEVLDAHSVRAVAGPGAQSPGSVVVRHRRRDERDEAEQRGAGEGGGLLGADEIGQPTHHQ